MFGRNIDINIQSPLGLQTTLVDHTLDVNTLICKGTIHRYPYSEIDKLNLVIYNLAPRALGELYANSYFNGGLLQVDFGYKDDGFMHRLFEGNVQRGQLKREDATTTSTTIYVWDSGDFVNYGFFGKSYQDGYNLYAIAEDVFKTNGVTSVNLTDKLKQFKTKGASAYSGSADRYLQQMSSDCGLYYKKENGLISIFSPEDGGTENVTYFTSRTDGKITGMSGLIGIPQLSNDGLSFECLINPALSIYSLIYMDNGIISIVQEGDTLTNVSMGATLSSNGLYRVVKIDTVFSNDGSEAKSTVKALAKDLYDEFIVSNAKLGTKVTKGS